MNPIILFSRFLRKCSLFAVLLLSLLPTSAPAADADLKGDMAKLQGKWKGKLLNDDGASDWAMEIQGNKTKLEVKSREGTVLARVECEFKLEQHGKFRAFTYWNVKHLAGDQEGHTELTGGKTRSSLIRFDGADKFSTIGGFRDDDDDTEHWLVRWEKA